MSRNERVSGNEKACLEIQSFLKALDSYAERFARKPGISFEQHHIESMPVKRDKSGRARRHHGAARKN